MYVCLCIQNAKMLQVLLFFCRELSHVARSDATPPLPSLHSKPLMDNTNARRSSTENIIARISGEYAHKSSLEQKLRYIRFFKDKIILFNLGKILGKLC